MLRIRKSLTTEQSQYSMRTVQREIVSQYETQEISIKRDRTQEKCFWAISKTSRSQQHATNADLHSGGAFPRENTQEAPELIFGCVLRFHRGRRPACRGTNLSASGRLGQQGAVGLC